MKNKEHVLFLHGYTGHGVTMKFMENYFHQHADYKLHIVSYLSLFRSPEEILEYLINELNYIFNKDDVVNIVGHSLGGLLARCLSASDKVNFSIKRIVTIGSPHRGTSLATNLMEIGVIKSLIPMATALSENSNFIRSLPKITVEMGSIAGSKKYEIGNLLTAITSIFMNPSTHDGLVEVESTYTTGLKDFIIFDVDHVTMILSEDVMEASLNFIRLGRFK